MNVPFGMAYVQGLCEFWGGNTSSKFNVWIFKMMGLVKSISSFKDCYFRVYQISGWYASYTTISGLFSFRKKNSWGIKFQNQIHMLFFVLLHFNFSWVSILPKDVCQSVGCLLARLVAELFCVCLVLFSLIFLLKLVQTNMCEHWWAILSMVFTLFLLTPLVTYEKVWKWNTPHYIYIYMYIYIAIFQFQELSNIKSPNKKSVKIRGACVFLKWTPGVQFARWGPLRSLQMEIMGPL